MWKQHELQQQIPYRESVSGEVGCKVPSASPMKMHSAVRSFMSTVAAISRGFWSRLRLSL
jgi:hypothetical protein